MQYFTRFFENLQQDLKAFVYWCLVLMLFRIVFIYIYSSQLNGNYAEVSMALLLGLRLSLKTAGILCLIGFVLASLPKIVFKSWPASKIRLVWHSIALVFFSICFMARIPYYGVFNAAFNMMLINGAHDDIKAILVTAIQEYQLLWRLPVAIIIGLVLSGILNLLLARSAFLSFMECRRKPLIIVGTVAFTVMLCIFVRYGGAFNYAHSINWESAARLKSNLLNEAILDDGQALYRVRASKKMLAKATNINISREEFRNKITLAGGNPNAMTIDAAFLHTVKQPKLSQQPGNVVILVGESFGQWPFLPKFKDLGLVNNMLGLQNSDHGTHVNTMLARGGGTISAVNGLLTGLPDTGLYENYQPMSFERQYQTGIAYIMKQLGYKTVFWYGGFAGWQNLKNFVLAQSFDEFHCAEEIDNAGSNAWGCPDEVLLQKVADYIKGEPQDSKVFHCILTTSNHPPYTVNVDQIGFSREQIRSKLSADISKDDKTLTELGHIWYADKTMGDFIKSTQKIRHDSLFIITGDHSERFNFAIEQEVRTLSTIPCIFYGQGVKPDLFNKMSYGTHIQIAGTLAEMIGPAGFKYSAVMPNMFENQGIAFNHALYAKEEELGSITKITNEKQSEYIKSLRSIAAWRVLKGNTIQ